MIFIGADLGIAKRKLMGHILFFSSGRSLSD